ncbi:MAG: 2OG-Fe(II) oxygenase family protein [Caulobacteraceae bacterium]
MTRSTSSRIPARHGRPGPRAAARLVPRQDAAGRQRAAPGPQSAGGAATPRACAPGRTRTSTSSPCCSARRRRGLEILTRDGRWLPVNPEPGALWSRRRHAASGLTNHVLPSTTHRVANPPPERRGAARLSTPFFLHFQPDFEIETWPRASMPGTPTAIPSRSPPTPICSSAWPRSA